MPVIELPISRTIHAPAMAIGHQLAAVRLTTHVCVKIESGWSPFKPAVVDTGAPVSLFPPSVWQHAKYRELGRVKIGGIARSEVCRIPALLAEIECMLADEKHTLGPLRIHAYLAEIEYAPRLIGILGFIERGILRVELSKNRATLRMS